MVGWRLVCPDQGGLRCPQFTILVPRGHMDPTDLVRFKRNVKQAVANYMDAIDPETGEVTHYGDDPDKFIDLVLLPYDQDYAEVTTPYLGTIVSYAWPDRMESIGARVANITSSVRRGFTTDMESRYPTGAELISFTFLGKAQGAWAVA